MTKILDALLGLTFLFGGFVMVIMVVYFMSYGLAKIGIPLLIYGLVILIFGQKIPRLMKLIALIGIAIGVAFSVI
jgi:hypothetical protein